MKTTVRKLLEAWDMEESQTVYAQNSEEVNTFCITAGDFFRPAPSSEWEGNYWMQDVYQERLRGRKQEPVFESLKRQIERLQKEIKTIKEQDPKGYDHMPQLRALRIAKRGTEKALGELENYYALEVERELCAEFHLGNGYVLSYKNSVCVSSFQDLKKQLPVLKAVTLPWLQKTPLLLGNIGELKQAVHTGTPVGLVGGPCLFGSYEVEVLVEHRDNSRFFYDFSSGRRYDRIDSPELAEHLEKYPDQIARLSFVDNKQGVTAQEYDSLEILFAFGAILGAKGAIPIPDISYLKYLDTIARPLRKELRMQALSDFRRVTQRIADLYLKLIEELKEKYPQVEVRVLHERNQEACEEFYRKRELYFRNSGLIKRLTAKRVKTDAILDYISMLALPYYFWETPQVIQIDNLDETDSFRKCRKVHKGAFSLSTILYPERLSANREQTIFNAPLAYKEYILERVIRGKEVGHEKDRTI